MHRHTVRLTLATCAVAAAGALALLFLQNRAEALHAQQDRVHAALRASHRRALALQSRTARAEKAATAPVHAVSSNPAPTTPAPAPKTNLARNQQAVERLRAMPEYARFIRRDLRRQTMYRYSDFFAELALPADRLERLKTLIDDHWGTLQDVHRAATAAGYKQGDADYSRLFQQHLNEGKARLREFLGAEDYARYESHELSADWRTNYQPELEEFLADRHAPALAATQRLAVRDAYLASLKWKSDAKDATSAAQLRLRHEQLCALAAPALTPAQREALAGYFKYINDRSDVMARLFHPDKPPGSIIVTRTYSRQ